MGQGDFEVDPNHDRTRRSINGVALVFLVIGVPLLLIGLGLFLRPMLLASSGFVGPQEMDERFHGAVVGMILMAIGGALTSFGSRGLFFANVGRIARYEAGEGLPVVKDVLRDLTPTLSQSVREISAAAHSASHSHRFCANCGAAAQAAAHFCQECGAKLEPAT